MNYILDTNVLLDDPYAIYKFPNHNVILTETIIEEIDALKKGNKELNVSARTISRELEKLRHFGNLSDGIDIENNHIQIVSDCYDIELPQSWKDSINDNRILQVALNYKNNNKDITIISQDINIKLKADILNIPSETYIYKLDNTYTGRMELYIRENDINKQIPLDTIFFDDNGDIIEPIFYPNQYILLKKAEKPNETLLGYVKDNYINLILNSYHPYSITPKNMGQTFAIHACMQPANILPLVIINGGSGTGKDFVTLACGLEQTFNENLYRKILITREIQPLGKDIGTLPGTEEEKLNPFLRGFIDNLEALVDSKSDNEKELQGKIDYLFETGVIKAEALSFMRGRSINKQFVIIDEAQNITINEMKGIVTRIGIDTKIVILGDTKQIDNIYLNENNNGLSWISNLMKESPLAAQITLKDSESVRSELVKDILSRL